MDLAVVAGGAHDHAVAVTARLDLCQTGAQRQFRGEHTARQRLQRRVGERADTLRASVQAHPDTQPVQCLRQFQADDTGPHHRHRARQVGPLEDIVVDDQPFPQRLTPGHGHIGSRTGGDDNTLRANLRFAHLQAVVVDEARVARQPVLGRPALHGVNDEADKTIPFTAHTRHHGAAVDGHRPGHHAEACRTSHRMRRFGRRDQQLAGHAADTGTGGAVDAALDHQHPRRVFQRRSVRRHAGRACTDDGDVGLDDMVCVHGRFSCLHRPSSLKPGWSSGRRP